MKEEFKQILRSLQYGKKYIYHCFNNTPNILKNTNDSMALTNVDKNVIHKISSLPIWNGWTLTIITLLQSLIIFVPLLDKKIRYDKNIIALLEDNSQICVALQDLRNCFAHNISEKFFSKVNQYQFVFTSKIEESKVDYTISFETLSGVMDNLENAIKDKIT